MKRIYLIRHGECNGKGTYAGRGTNLSLNGEGRKTIFTLAEKLKKEGIRPVRIITSTLERARESSRIISEIFDFSSMIQEDSRLDEMDFGLWEGLTYDEICQNFPDESQHWIRDSWNNSAPRGETAKEMAERVSDFFHNLMSSIKEEEGEILIIAHGGSLRMLLCLFMGMSPCSQWQFRLDRSGMAGIDICGDLPVLFRMDQKETQF